MTITRSKAKSLCTAGELALVDASGPKNINKLSAAQLRQKVSRARSLHDKWRGQAESQRRAAQSALGSRQTGAAARSAEKAELFAEVLRRFESQLAKTEAPAPSRSSSRQETPRKTRNRQHRAVRAVVRDELSQTRLELSVKKTPAKKAAGRKVAKKSAVDGADGAVAAKAPAAKSAVKRASTKRATKAKGGVRRKGIVATGKAGEPLGVESKQPAVVARAKKNRLQAAGVKRMQVHASARNKRNQAKRDSR